MALFAPRYVKEGKAVYKGGHKILAYRRDLLKPAEVEALEQKLEELRQAVRDRDRPRTETLIGEVEKAFTKRFPAEKHAGWRENVEVIVVAVVIAVGVRAYFLQPFTIPTGSMQPTLSGVVGISSTAPAPNPLKQAFEFVTLGRNYIDLVSEDNDQVLSLRQMRRFHFFTLTEVLCEKQRFVVYAPADVLRRDFGLKEGRPYRAGEVMARGQVNSGDFVFVDKMSYNFRRPQRGEVFVFKTTGITEIERNIPPGLGSQYYIKRLAGTPGDRLRIEPPVLYVNGEPAREPPFQRVMSMEDGYRGYAPGPRFLNRPDALFRLPAGSYFGLGDNSYNSSDSRYWGIVPEKNVTGRGFIVFWPFTPHWGLIR